MNTARKCGGTNAKFNTLMSGQNFQFAIMTRQNRSDAARLPRAKELDRPWKSPRDMSSAKERM